MKKLAEEALRVGEMLGIKVISHRANAIKGITGSIKAKSKNQSYKGGVGN